MGEGDVQTIERTDEIASRINALIMTGDVQLPALPEVAIRAQEILSSEELDTRELGELLTGDPAIAAALLRLANSAHFGGMQEVGTVLGAVQRIGMREVGAIVTGLSLRSQFDHPQPDKKALLQSLWDHSVTTAFAAQALAFRVGVDEEHAFLGGLLHDCGKVLVLSCVDRLETDGCDFEPSRELILELMTRLHCDLGCHLLVSWNIPGDLATVARDHQVRIPGASDLLLCVQAANHITRKLGYHLSPDPELNLSGLPVIEDLGISDIELATLMIDMEDHLEEMKSLF